MQVCLDCQEICMSLCPSIEPVQVTYFIKSKEKNGHQHNYCLAGDSSITIT